MLNKVRNISFALILAMSILTPLVVNLLPVEENIVLFSDLEEEDPKEIEIKDLFFAEKNNEYNGGRITTMLISEVYKSKVMSFPLEVISPPPEANLF